MNLSNLITEAQRLAGRVDSDWKTRTRRWLNEAQTQWAMEVPWPTLERIETFVADGTNELILPSRVLTIRWVGDKTNQRPVDAGGAWDREYPTAYFGDTAGSLLFWRDKGVTPIARAPASTGQIRLQTTASDSFNAYVAGLAIDTAASGTPDYYYEVSEQVAISNDSVYTTTHEYYQIDVIGKDDFTNGDVLFKDTTGSQLARLGRNDYRSLYRRIEWLKVPTSNTEIRIGYITQPRPLISDGDIPNPAVDVEYLIWYAAAMILTAMGQEQNAAIKRARAEEIMRRRIVKERSHGDRDWRSYPEPTYWGTEDMDVVGEDR